MLEEAQYDLTDAGRLGEWKDSFPLQKKLWLIQGLFRLRTSKGTIAAQCKFPRRRGPIYNAMLSENGRCLEDEHTTYVRGHCQNQVPDLSATRSFGFGHAHVASVRTMYGHCKVWLTQEKRN
jgi:hypothetical protein